MVPGPPSQGHLADEGQVGKERSLGVGSEPTSLSRYGPRTCVCISTCSASSFLFPLGGPPTLSASDSQALSRKPIYRASGIKKPIMPSFSPRDGGLPLEEAQGLRYDQTDWTVLRPLPRSSLALSEEVPVLIRWLRASPSGLVLPAVTPTGESCWDPSLPRPGKGKGKVTLLA